MATSRRVKRKPADAIDLSEFLPEERSVPTIVDLFDVPRYDDDYLVKGLVNRSSITFLHADPGVGKSFMALDLALSLGVGFGDWCGFRTVGSPCSVLYIYSEGVRRLWKRRDAWLQHNDVPERDLKGQIGIHQGAFSLNKAADAGRVDLLIKLLRDREADLIVFDTWATSTTGSNENDSGEMGVALARAGRIRDEVGCAVLVVHHDNKQGSMRGSSSIPGYCDTIIGLEAKREDGTKVIRAVIEKGRDDADAIEWVGRLAVEGLGVDGDGDEVTSVAYEYLGRQEALQGATTPREELLSRLEAEPLGKTEAVRETSGAEGGGRFKKYGTEFERLFNEGLIEKAGEKKVTHRKTPVVTFGLTASGEAELAILRAAAFRWSGGSESNDV